MKALARLRPFLPLALRVLSTATAALAPIAATAATKEPITLATFGAAFVAGAAAWKRWHPDASLSILWGDSADAAVHPATASDPETP